MWVKKPKYNLNDCAVKIDSYSRLPNGSNVMAVFNRYSDSEDARIYFVKNNGLLSILDVSERILKSGREMKVCVQTDVSYKFFEWFPLALKNFMRSPSEGGLHAGAMITPDEDVDGEMLCICRISIPTGYEVINRSRCDWEYVGTEHFENQSIEFNDYVLFDAGVLEWIESGKWKAFV